jgi:Kdo2-lipid IVA lauroyltransferase/acyltransferase
MRPSVAHRLEALALRAGIAFARALGPVAASNFGGGLMRRLGPLLPASRTADRNLQLALPALDATQRARIVRGAWDNLGRTAAELPHLATLRASNDGPGWELEGAEHLTALREAGGPAIFFSGHLANWELIGPAVAAFGIPMAGFYRAASNTLADDLIQGLRREARGGAFPMFAKGSTGARAAIAHLQGGGFLGMMMDQKMNDGIPVAFFGHDAMTAPALGHFALRFDCAVLPIHVVRLGPARFRVICQAPLNLPRDETRADGAYAVTRDVNRILEDWIRAAPEQWFWLHKRWPREQKDAA